MRAILPLCFVLLSPLVQAEEVSSDVSDIDIGGKTSPKSHLSFEGISKDAKIVKISTHLIVKEVAPKGLNFFASQVNFPNKTWAHGGPQFNDGKNELANWGGLVNRGGGSADYEQVDWSKDLALIECGVGKPNTVPWSWQRNTEYILTVVRGEKVVLPEGFNREHKVKTQERTMWEWNFTIVPVTKQGDTAGESFTSKIYDSADHIDSFYLWNEAGYGSTGEEQHAVWSMPTYRAEGNEQDLTPTKWHRF